MKPLFYGVTVYNAVIFILLIVYFPIVWLNLVFTFDYLSSNDVPYYDNASSAYDRYNAMWWIIALDILRFVGPAMASFTLGLMLLEKSGMVATLLWYTIIMIILMVLEIAKAVVFTWQWVYCSDYQLCRNFNPSGNPSSANYVFIIMTVSDYGFFLFFIIYLGLSSAMGKYARGSAIAGLYNKAGDDDDVVLNVEIPADRQQPGYYRKYLSAIESIPEPKKKRIREEHSKRNYK